MISIANDKLLIDGIEILPAPDLSLVSAKASSCDVLDGIGANESIIHAKIGTFNLTLNMAGHDVHSAALWLSQAEDIGANWDQAESNEARRAERHIELLKQLFGQSSGTVGGYVVEPFMDKKTYLHIIAVRQE
jgi:hypothetical protein